MLHGLQDLAQAEERIPWLKTILIQILQVHVVEL